MNHQSQVVLAIGTNQGNRLENILTAIDCIHNEVGTVIKVSKLYETPAWGFDSGPFYNCALVLHTANSANDILVKVLDLETKLGRIRTEKEGYESRVIDIDVITYNEDIIETEKLKVPHPLMQERLFVLLPMRDLNLDWRHPILQKYLPDLLRASEDKSNCKVLQNLESPLRKLLFNNLNHIVIEGNIGSGKTSLSNKISEDFNAKSVLERFAENPFLPLFYEDQSRYAFSLEMSFLADRFQQISDDLAQFDLFKDFIIADYHIFKSLIFAKVTLSDDEFRLYRTFFEIIYKEMPKPDLYVYLYQNTNRLLENIKKRGRSYELDIAPEYLEKINQGYLDFIKTQKDLNVLIIDVSNRDFIENQEDYVFILNEIQRKIN
ncbi:MAG TPA: 2-amino-4-hydroxy-6-hydroxymethyldihydropteridine diphosphokinase [Flavobacterium sp.]|jgi:2-amino-4-hydroxy-6-hydroxymethyldihydropteridine diphosphokinase|nr:2-amino-4-hydroxy-6-hydroxymethyldihydropteridine diphosphokinase [Flavobacterium sp.]